MARLRAAFRWAAISVVLMLPRIQLVPYGRDHSNPATGRRIPWDSKRTQWLMSGACMDCHSNETRWPW